jgi:hypothetical protein
MSDPQEGEDEAKMVPLAALEDERQKRQTLENDVNYLKGQQQQFEQRLSTPPQQQQQPPAQQTYTRTELSNFVLEGKINQDQADDIMDAQLQRNIETRIGGKLAHEAKEREIASALTSDFDAYTKAIPNISVQGTPERTRLEAEYRRLTQLGQPDSRATEVLALRSAFGPPETINAAKEQSGGASHQETGGGSAPGSNDGDAGKGAPSTLTAAEKSYYEGAMKEGLYKDWSEVRAEMKFANPQVRTRTAARGI